MSVAQIVRNFIDNIDNGKLFSYNDIRSDQKSVVAIELSRLSKKGNIKRLTKGKYYKPKQGYFGEMLPNDIEVIQSYLNEPNSYITGMKAFNEMGLTTQVTNVVTIATEKQPRKVQIKNLTIKFVPITQPVRKEDIYLVRVLDAIESMKNIPDATADDIISYVIISIKDMSGKELKKLVRYSLKYRPRTKAILGAILEVLGYEQFAKQIKETLNSLSSYKVGVSQKLLPNKSFWKII